MAILDLGPSFEQTWYRCTRQCYITKFQKSVPGGSEEEDFHIFLCISMVRTLDPWPGHLESGTLV